MNFVKATLDTILGFIDGAVDYLIDLVNQALIEAIPELRTLFEPFQFDIAWYVRSTWARYCHPYQRPCT